MTLFQRLREGYLEGQLDRALRREIEFERRLLAAKAWSREVAKKLRTARKVQS